MSDCLLMIFVKNLIPGTVKTRLAKDIGISHALDVYMELVRHTHQIANKIDVDKGVYYSEYVEIEDIWNAENYIFHIQKGYSLGEKMANAFDKAFHTYNKVIIIGSDCYDLTVHILKEAFIRLEKHDVVVGPAKDGGYYLLGMSKFFPQLFKDKKYGHENVLNQLLKQIDESKLSVYQLPTLRDIDTLEDLKESGMDWQP